jgi:hypothetical protein
MVNIGSVEVRTGVSQHCRGVGGQHADAEVVAEACADFPTLELKGPAEGKRAEPGRGWTAGTAGGHGRFARLVCRHQWTLAGPRHGPVRPAWRTHAAPLRWCPGCQDRPRGRQITKNFARRHGGSPTAAGDALRLACQTTRRPWARGTWPRG